MPPATANPQAGRFAALTECQWARPDQVDLAAGITPASALVFRCASKNAAILRLASCADGW